MIDRNKTIIFNEIEMNPQQDKNQTTAIELFMNLGQEKYLFLSLLYFY
jgi:hypothetical protein